MKKKIINGPKSWVSIYDDWGEPDGSISGNIAGLQALKKSIDEAILEGTGKIDPKIVQADFISIFVTDDPPEETKRTSLIDFIKLFFFVPIIMAFLGALSAVAYHSYQIVLSLLQN